MKIDKNKVASFFSFIWSIASLVFQLLMLIFSFQLFETSSQWFLPTSNINADLLLLFRLLVCCAVVVNVVSFFVHDKNMVGNRFLWFIGLTFGATLLFLLSLLVVVVNTLLTYFSL